MESITLGVDIGASLTKIVGCDSQTHVIGTLHRYASEGKDAYCAAIDGFLRLNHIPLAEVSRIALTGMGSTQISGNYHGIPTVKVPEFEALGTGGLAISGKQKAIIMSMGTGTAFVRATPNQNIHIGGSGIGGGTLMGLSKKWLHEKEFSNFVRLSEEGDLHNIDLFISDICNDKISTLPPDMTASNFGNVKSTASDADYALGIINLVLQVSGTLAVFACQNSGIKDVVLTGSLTQLPQAPEIFEPFHKIYNLNFCIPENAPFAAAIGAVLFSLNAD